MGIGRLRSASVSRDSALIGGVEGELRVHKAFLLALRSGSVFRRRGSAVAVPLDLRETAAPTEWAGFWAIIEPSSVECERTVNPTRVSVEGRVGRDDARLRM